MSKKNKAIISITTFIFIMVLLYPLMLGCSTYKFGISVDEHPDIFDGKGQGLNPNYIHYQDKSRRFSDSTNIFFPSDQTSTTIKVEHLVPVVEFDIETFPEVTDTGYLFSAIAFPISQIRSVSVKHSYAGNDLKRVASYIYTASTIKEKRWKISKAANINNLQIKEPFVFVTLYKMPPHQRRIRNFFPKKHWFKHPITEIIKVEYELEGKPITETFEYKLHWFLYITKIERFLYSY